MNKIDDQQVKKILKQQAKHQVTTTASDIRLAFQLRQAEKVAATPILKRKWYQHPSLKLVTGFGVIALVIGLALNQDGLTPPTSITSTPPTSINFKPTAISGSQQKISASVASAAALLQNQQLISDLSLLAPTPLMLKPLQKNSGNEQDEAITEADFALLTEAYDQAMTVVDEFYALQASLVQPEIIIGSYPGSYYPDETYIYCMNIGANQFYYNQAIESDEEETEYSFTGELKVTESYYGVEVTKQYDLAESESEFALVIYWPNGQDYLQIDFQVENTEQQFQYLIHLNGEDQLQIQLQQGHDDEEAFMIELEVEYAGQEPYEFRVYPRAEGEHWVEYQCANGQGSMTVESDSQGRHHYYDNNHGYWCQHG